MHAIKIPQMDYDSLTTQFLIIENQNILYFQKKKTSSRGLQRLLQRASSNFAEERATSTFTVIKFGSCRCRST